MKIVLLMTLATLALTMTGCQAPPQAGQGAAGPAYTMGARHQADSSQAVDQAVDAPEPRHPNRASREFPYIPD